MVGFLSFMAYFRFEMTKSIILRIHIEFGWERVITLTTSEYTTEFTTTTEYTKKYSASRKVWETLSPPIWQSACLDRGSRPNFNHSILKLMQSQNWGLNKYYEAGNAGNCQNDEVGNSCNCTIWKCTRGGFVRNVHRAGEKKKSTFRHKASSFPGLINRLLPRCKTAAFLEKVFKQWIFFLINLWY